MDTSALTNSIKAITINHPNHFVAVDSNNDMFFWHNTPSTWKPFNKKAKMIFSEPESAKIYRVIENDSLYMCTPDYGSIMPETWVWEQIGGTVKTIATYNDKLYAITTDANKTIHRYISPNHWEIIGGSGQSLCVTDQHKVFASTKSTGGGLLLFIKAHLISGQLFPIPTIPRLLSRMINIATF